MLNKVQGRRKLPKAGWASSTMGGPFGLDRVNLKSGWAIARPAHPSPTPIKQVCLKGG